LGEIRAEEIMKSSKVFGIRHENVILIDDPGLQDGFQYNWSPEIISTIIYEYSCKFCIDMVYI
jgi:hypothetical protein